MANDYRLSEDSAADDDGSDHADEVADPTSGNGVAVLFYLPASKQTAAT
ncbi:MAG: hypothetical protein ACR2NX_04500 [Chthoniobacterales bacterium]